MTDIFIPLLLPLFSGIFCLIFWRKLLIQKVLFLIGAGSSLLFCCRLLGKVWTHGIISVQAGSWKAPFGITFVADLLCTGIMVVVSFVTLMIAVYSEGSIDRSRARHGLYPVLLFLLFGIFGALLAGDIFNLYVWFEIIMVASFVLLALGGTGIQLEGSIKYLAINFLASSLIIAGVADLNGITGTLNMADLALKVASYKHIALPNLAAVFVIVGFGVKSAVFPLYFWLPASYPTPPVAITAMIGGVLTKVGAYVLIRYFTLIFTQDILFTHHLLIYAAALTMITGAVGAIAQVDFHKILSFSIVSQIGYIIMSLGLFNPLALAAATFFLIHSILIKTNLFLISGVVYASNRSYKLQELGGIYKRFPLVALFFLISGLSLTGLPPLTGFWGKFLLIKAGFDAGAFLAIGIAIGTSVLTLFYIIKIWNEVFWRKDPEISSTKEVFPVQFEFLKQKAFLIVPVGLITCVILYISFFPDLFIHYARQTAEQLMNKEYYIKAVLGK